MKTHSLILSLGLMFLLLFTLSTSVFAGDNHSGEITLPSNDKLVEVQNISPAATLQIVSITPYTFNGGVNIRCWGQNTGQATVLVSGGTAPYSYMWLGLPSQTTEVASGLYAGTYTVVVTDATGASVTDSVTLIQNPPLQSIATAAPIPCYGGVSVVTVSASGGTTPYSGLNLYDVIPGTYYFTVADANGCRDRDTVIVTEPAILDIIATPTAIMCFGDTSQVTVSGTGGTLPYYGTGVFDEVVGSYTYYVTDANGCTDNTTLTINQPGALVTAAVATTISCYGETADVTVSVLSGSEPYSGVGSFIEYAGVYEYIVVDNNGCTDSVSVSITQPSELVMSISTTSIDCNGGSTDVTVTATGGMAPYTGIGTFSETAGTYTYTVTDANGCTSTTTVTITEPTQVVASSTATFVDCSGGSSDVTVTASGGTAPYTGTEVFSETAGTYTYTVTDANGCTSSTTVTITEPTQLVANSSATSIDCNGGSSDVTVTATGGTAPYTGTEAFSETAGTYTYTVTDANGCTSSTTVTITEPTQLVANSSATSIDCNGGSSDVTVTATGGTAPYTGTGTFSETAGTYTYTVTDANGCTSITTVAITEPTLLTASISSTGVDCTTGTSDVTVVATGGTAPYTGTGTFSETVGTYMYTVTDNNGCTVDVSTIIAPPISVVATSTATSIDCNGGSSDVTVTGTGGTAPYIGTGAFSETAGTYTYTVTDANECVSSTTITITQPAQLSTSVSATSIGCNGGLSDVTVAATGGVAPYIGTGAFSETAGTYTYSVTDANGCSAGSLLTITEPAQLMSSISSTVVNCSSGLSEVTVTATGGTVPYVGTGTFFESVGTHIYTISDANGCTIIDSVAIVGSSQLNVTVSSTNITCSGGLADVTVTASGGSAPYTGTGVFSETAGTYTYNVTDAAGCSGSQTISISEPPSMTAYASCPSILCNGGTEDVLVFAFGGMAPYTGTGIFTVSVGTYSFEVVDANGCVSYATLGVSEPNSIQANVSPQNQTIDCIPVPVTIDASPTGGLAPYSYVWSNGSTNSSITVNPNETTVYAVTITDANGCTVNSGSTVTVLNRCGNKNHKVVICHVPPGNSNNPQTICISQNALNSHLANAWNLHGGDYCGPCNSTPSSNGSASSLILAEDTDLGENSFIRAAINTKTNLVELSYRLTYDSDVRVEVYDLSGALVEVIHENNAREGELYDLSVNPTKFTSGVYIYQFITDKEIHIDKMQFVK